MLEVALAGGAGAGLERALAVADLDQVAQGVAGLVGIRLAAVVAVVCGDGLERDGVVQAAGQGDGPGPAPGRVVPGGVA